MNGLPEKTFTLVNTGPQSVLTHIKNLIFHTLATFSILRNQILECVIENVTSMTYTIHLMNEENIYKELEDRGSGDDDIVFSSFK